MPAHRLPPEPPQHLPPARTVPIPGRGELFLRDTGGDGPAVMLLHGWLVTADLNWRGAYGDLVDAGYRVLAIDHRGHGRGLRTQEPFGLADCASDVAAALRTLDVAPALVAGYSMGGAVAQLLARDHPDVVRGLVLSATSQHWQDPHMKRAFRAMGVVWVLLSVAPKVVWRWGFRQVGLRESPETVWMQGELLRGFARDLAEAGRELRRFDSRPWLHSVSPPIAVVITSRDESVPVRRQRELAASAGASVFEAPINHLDVVTRARVYNPALLAALDAVEADQDVKAA